MINRNIKLALIGVLLFGLSIFSLNISETIITNENVHDNNITNHLKSAGFWNLTGSPISIYDNDPNKNWSYTASHYDWCSGSGTWIDPYIIENITINGQGLGSCIEIWHSNTYFIIRNCSLYNSGSIIDNAGILLYNVNNSKIINNNCSDNYNGIETNYCNNNTFSGNTVNNNIFNGIRLGFGNKNILSGNLMNFCGVNIWGSLVESASQVIDDTNLVNNKPVYYYVNEIGLRSSDFTNAGQIILVNCNNSIISGLDLSNSTIGIDLHYSNNNTLLGNTANNNYYGIGLVYCNNNTLTGNTANYNTHGIVVSFSNDTILTGNIVCNNSNFGIATDRSNNNIISKNIANNNSHGIVLAGTNNSIYFKNIIRGNNIYGVFIYGGMVSTQNLFFENIFLNNNIHAYDDGINNYWNNSIIGNYWDNYTGVDADQDGIGDTPHYFHGGIDFLPIVDDQAPTIEIQSPISNELFGINAPNFVIEIIELYLDTLWYTIDGGITNNTFTENGTINQELWDTLSNGTATITFYANDFAGNKAFSSVIVRVDKIIPSITIHSPIENQLFGTNVPSPMFNISVDDIFYDKKWYTLNQDSTKYFFTSPWDYINQTTWTGLPDGSVKMRFYANDSAGNIGFSEVTIRKDINAPILTINNPQNNIIIGATAPNFNITIDEPNLDKIWYSLNGGTNITFTGLTGIINQGLWDALPEGNIIIRFYANDTLGRIGFAEVTIKKDVTAPIITINTPQNSVIVGAIAPNFNISIDEPNLDKVWYSLKSGTNITFTGLTGIINQALWDVLLEGNITIRFYASDSAGNIGFQEVTVIKKITQPSALGIPGYNLLFLLGIISTVAVIIVKKRVNDLN